MIVAVIAVLMVQTAVDDIVGMVAMRNRFMTAACAVNMSFAAVNRMAAVRIEGIDTQTVFVVMPIVLVMKMAIMQIIDMPFVSDGGMTTARTVNMRVI